MNTIYRKYRKKFSILLLTGFIAFTVLGILHHHKYNFSNKYSFSETSSSPLQSSDLRGKLFFYFNLHQFGQTIIDIHYSSSDITNTLYQFSLNVSINDISNYSSGKYSLASPRASPLAS